MFKGGGQLAVHQLACALSAKGHEVHALYSKYPDEHFEVEVPYKIHWAQHHDFATVNLNIFSYSKVLAPLAAKEKFDVIHGNAEESCGVGNIAARIKAAYVFTSHAPNIPTTGILQGMAHPIRFLKSINTYLLRQAMVEADRIVAFSQFSRELIVKGLGNACANRVEVIPPGIESSWFDVERNQVVPAQLLFWGRMEEEKGLPELFVALNTVAKKFLNVKLTLVGEGNLLQEYKTRVTDLGLADRVKFAGWLNNWEIQTLAAKSSIGIFPSRIESFGLSVVEAMATGLPVIAARGGAVPENIEDGVTGTLVPVNNSDALAEAINRALEDPKSSEMMAKSAKTEVQQKFSWDRAADSMIEIYNNIRMKTFSI
ncbi:MAG: glycosyltransferase involved in cell wall biosynthesis [Nitrospinales bacterium]|jgi:glycosyltransferase involved in cell wall biosynthesis